ncbi:hypothetical protein GCM10022275_16380 [Tessaracoccus defluvii]
MRDRIRRIANPVSPEFFQDTSRGEVPQKTLVFVGSLGEQKQPIAVLEALAFLASAFPPVRAVFAGSFASESYEREFFEAMRRLGVADRVELLGFVSDVSGVLTGTSGVFVLPSVSEGSPGALGEAMALGMVPVVTDIGAMGDIVRQSGIGRVVEGSGASIARAVSSLWREPGEWAGMAADSRAYARSRFSQASVCESYLRHLEIWGRR